MDGRMAMLHCVPCPNSQVAEEMAVFGTRFIAYLQLSVQTSDLSGLREFARYPFLRRELIPYRWGYAT